MRHRRLYLPGALDLRQRGVSEKTLSVGEPNLIDMLRCKTGANQYQHVTVCVISTQEYSLKRPAKLGVFL